MNLTAEELARLKNAKSLKEWSSICDDIRNVRGGNYPLDWNELVIQSGVLSKFCDRIGS